MGAVAMTDQPFLLPDYMPAPTIGGELALMRRDGGAGIRDRAPGHTCHRCHAPATQQWPRHATPDEAEDWHAAREQHIRAHNDGRPEADYVANRADAVTLAVHGCNNHVVDDPRRTHDADCGGHGACQCGGVE